MLKTDEKVALVNELRGQIIECVADQNGNHVIQKCIESIKPSKHIQFVLEVGPRLNLHLCMNSSWLA